MGTAAKRLLDIIGAFLGLLVLAVPFALVGLAIKLDSRGPVFFRRERAGKDGKPFIPLKFRTMVDEAMTIGQGAVVSQEDDRITRVGRVLRSTSFDELPQLFNVLTGEMSLVGPRPGWVYQAEAYDDFQRGRLRVRPGVTGLAAVSGRNALTWERRIEIDNWYIDHWSIWLDLKILALTPWKLITREGIYGAGGVNEDLATVPKKRQATASSNEETPEPDPTDPR